MSKLLQTGLRRYLVSPLWWLTAVTAAVTGAYFGLTFNRIYSFESMAALVPTILFAILLSLSIGREFGDGTVRNKIVAGHRKGAVFISELILGVGACLCLSLLFLITFAIFQAPYLSRVPIGVFGKVFAALFFLYLSTAAMMTVLSLLIANKSASAIVCLLLILVLVLLSDNLHSALNRPEFYRTPVIGEDGEGSFLDQYKGYMYNPNYVKGTRRKVYQFVLDLLPVGQIVECCAIVDNCISETDRYGKPAPYTPTEEESRLLDTCSYYAVGLSVVFSAIGWLIFRKRDLK
ncbi:MAG: ABC transporter permease subunit [Clostridia bacterium]|nr:ABC transporter permease subunit [Clostridia bacterium]